MADKDKFFDIEYVGGPEDGHKTFVLTLEECLNVCNEESKIVHHYHRTNQRTKEGFLVYAYAGYQKS